MSSEHELSAELSSILDAHRAVFLWPKGNPNTWAISTGDIPVLTYGGAWPSYAEGFEYWYMPLERPEIYEEFAAIGELALEVGDHVEARLDGLEDELRDGKHKVSADGTTGGIIQAASADEDRRVQKRLLQFVSDYGPPRKLTSVEIEPRRFGDQWSVGITVFELLMDAAFLHRTMELARDVELLAAAYDADRAEQTRKIEALASRLSRQMDGTSLTMIVDSGDPAAPRLRPTSTCADLIGAMWLQLYEAVSRGRTWRICEGCGRLFNPGREKQTYHNAPCRNRANVRRHAAKRRASDAR